MHNFWLLLILSEQYGMLQRRPVSGNKDPLRLPQESPESLYLESLDHSVLRG